MFKKLYQGIFGNFRLKLVALALSVVVWWFAASRLRQEIELSVPLNLAVPAGYQLLAQTHDTIRVRVSGPQLLTARLEKDLAMSRKLSQDELQDGQVTLPVTEDWANISESELVQLKVSVMYPRQVTAYASPIGERMLPVRASLVGKPREGFEIVDRRIVPSQVRVQGPECVIERLEYVEAVEISVSDIESDLEADVALVAQKIHELAEGLELSVPLELNPSRVTLRVAVRPLEQERRFADVPVAFLTHADFPYKVEIEEEERSVVVIVSGLPQNIERLKAESLVAYIDLKGLAKEEVGAAGSLYRETVQLIWPLDIPLSGARTEPETVRFTLKNPVKRVE